MRGKYSNVKKGYAEDLNDGNRYASGWERDVARFLTYLQSKNVIEGFAYEPQVFSFQGLGYKRNPFTYIPDFAVRFNHTIGIKDKIVLENIFDEVHPGKTVFWEVKGREMGSDRSKWRRFRKHSGYPLEVVKRDKMVAIQLLFAKKIPYWESSVY